jgi:sulfite dehydrogenase (cytochrome) subunit B
MRVISCAVATVLTALLAAPAVAEEPVVTLKPGPGLEKVEGNCGACHSLDYIQMNSPFLSEKAWDAEINKMIKVFGAPIDGGDVPDIAAYLKKNYGG